MGFYLSKGGLSISTAVGFSILPGVQGLGNRVLDDSLIQEALIHSREIGCRVITRHLFGADLLRRLLGHLQMLLQGR